MKIEISGHFETAGEAAFEIAKQHKGKMFTLEINEFEKKKAIAINCKYTTRRGNCWYWKGQKNDEM